MSLLTVWWPKSANMRPMPTAAIYKCAAMRCAVLEWQLRYLSALSPIAHTMVPGISLWHPQRYRFSIYPSYIIFKKHEYWSQNFRLGNSCSNYGRRRVRELSGSPCCLFLLTVYFLSQTPHGANSLNLDWDLPPTNSTHFYSLGGH